MHFLTHRSYTAYALFIVHCRGSSRPSLCQSLSLSVPLFLYLSVCPFVRPSVSGFVTMHLSFTVEFLGTQENHSNAFPAKLIIVLESFINSCRRRRRKMRRECSRGSKAKAWEVKREDLKSKKAVSLPVCLSVCLPGCMPLSIQARHACHHQTISIAKTAFTE